MPFRHCRHTKVDGTFCQAAALRERDYCRFHLENLGRRIRMARSRARREPYRLVLPILEDLASVLVARQQVMDALAAGVLDPRVGGKLLYGLQGTSSDLRSANPPRLGVYDEQTDTAPRAEEYANFEEDFDLPKDLDLSRPLEVTFAEAAAAAAKAESSSRAERSAYRSNPWNDVQPEDVELEEVLFTQGQEAHDKRSAELQRREWKRIDQEKRKLAQAHQTVEAAHRNGLPFNSSGQKAFYERCAADNAIREKARQEEIAAMRAAAMAQAEARKAPESAGVEEVPGDSEKTGS